MMIASLSGMLISGGAIAGAVGVFTALLGYRRGRQVDEITKQSQVDEKEGRGVDQVIAGLNKLVENLQADNAVLRDNVRALDDKLTVAIEQIEGLRTEIRELKDRLASS